MKLRIALLVLTTLSTLVCVQPNPSGVDAVVTASGNSEMVEHRPSGADREVLETLYEACWGHQGLYGWLSNTPLNEWEGVTTDEEGRVIELDLRSSGLGGELPPRIGELDRLERLFLQENRFSGEIPPELGNLKNLRLLYLYENDFSGQIPPELGDLDNLTLMLLDRNELSGLIPRELTGMAIGLYGNSVNLPDNDRDKAALSELYFAIGGSQWGENTNWLSDRPLGEWEGVLVDGRGRVTGLFLSGGHSEVEIPISSLARLDQLRVLWVHAALAGEIPPELGDLENLSWIDLEDNRLTGEIPPELGKLKTLGWLNLEHNQLSGEIPPQLGNLPNLESLMLEYNMLSGEIPSELGNLSNLLSLTLRENRLSGAIPRELGNLSKLRQLWLRGNELSGCIPDTIQHVSRNDLSKVGLPFC